MNRIFRQQWKDYIKVFYRPRDLLYSPRVVRKPQGKQIVVLSPHFDDDVLGCGGTLRKHVLDGDQVEIIYFTDGREGDPDEPDKDVAGQRRKEEARAATHILGIEELIFLDQPETQLKSTPQLLNQLGAIFSQFAPDLIYVPSFLENHVDHLELNRILLKLADRQNIQADICAYEIWTPIIPNIVVDIGEVMPLKKQAIACFASQLKQVDYAAVALGLNKYRSAASLKGATYAEAFLHTCWNDYIAYMRKLQINKRMFIKK